MKLFRKVCHDGPTLIYSFAMTCMKFGVSNTWTVPCPGANSHSYEFMKQVSITTVGKAMAFCNASWSDSRLGSWCHQENRVSGKKLQKTSFFLCLVMSCPTEADHQTFTTGMTMGHKSPPKKVASGSVFLYFLVFPFIPLLAHGSEISKLC